MPYLQLHSLMEGDYLYNSRNWPRLQPVRITQASKLFWYGPIDKALETMLDDWSVTKEWDDTNLSGVIADWLTEHRDELLTNASGPSDPAARLDALIDYLRARFHSSTGV